ncbi:hypothetical protein [Cyanobium sp. Morenito 9A2]|uniref:hypothetical protein n=1 Tax=Cyanobium sp. Morenito 9A2 TaxID=2823718 RepID=UPI0020CED5AA|nr:hypothetical protein [Cyanobium sp. Morenito 9A2]MCP9848416.1 hypothetical protein [Cyanobium sp. Morenito 9A2]
MLKGEVNRAEELKELGWPVEEVRRYAELWEYRQRWGAINLEPEDRVFLRQAEAALPKLATGKGSARKSFRDKSHVRWLAFHLEAFKAAEAELGLASGELGAWRIVLEEELRALAYDQPVLGLPDTLKAKALIPLRNTWAAEAAASGRVLSIDFNAPLEALRAREKTSWKPLRGEEAASASDYPVLEGEAAAIFRAQVRQAVIAQIRSTFPSLKDTDKPLPPDDWQPA